MGDVEPRDGAEGNAAVGQSESDERLHVDASLLNPAA